MAKIRHPSLSRCLDWRGVESEAHIGIDSRLITDRAGYLFSLFPAYDRDDLDKQMLSASRAPYLRRTRKTPAVGRDDRVRLTARLLTSYPQCGPLMLARSNTFRLR